MLHRARRISQHIHLRFVIRCPIYDARHAARSSCSYLDHSSAWYHSHLGFLHRKLLIHLYPPGMG
jgi:hypothetical protein